MDAGPTLVLTAGAITFTNEWLQTNKPQFRPLVAGMVGAAIIAGVSDIAPRAGTALGIMVLIVAVTTEFNGKSAVSEFASVLPVTPVKGK
jgi:uncharacterized membrane protein YdcZ (DUF606 family)